MNELFVEVANGSLTKFGEELCGDKVEVVRGKDTVTIVLADGLGSGVKANILATLTAKIAATMRSKGASIDEVVTTIIQTLPTCKVRQLAYSTLSLLEIDRFGQAYLVEFDNPPVILLHQEQHQVQSQSREVAGRLVRESRFQLAEGDFLALISDGVVHAGVGAVLNLGWQWQNVADYLERMVKAERRSVGRVVRDLLDVCENLYQFRPGDDATVVGVSVRRPVKVCLFTGPPMDPKDDEVICRRLAEFDGIKVVCGGTAANILARCWGKEARMEEYIDEDIPPTAVIEGIDLVTEGILTLNRAVEMIHRTDSDGRIPNGRDGASRLARLLLEDCTELTVLLGQRINPAHLNPQLPVRLGPKVQVIGELVELLQKRGKQVRVEYF
ncbi:MAG TPA: serine/threonine-protein phosphatase [Firmicutes bacterium]|jgi:hypothetical protein|nr:serine/threonine-protein phosphatase [Bacillota bacterium]HOQ24747.1 PP2C family protein-serine/threonine phosphatase [Bacillota bacterium]HPT67442.1 PP2C family protein-serine/threonine phosphatase [Bacillota bacterium]